MIQFDGTWWFPDGEQHIPQWMTDADRRVEGRLTYQYHKYEIALGLCQQWRTAVDVGAHVGLWSYWMARDFRVVEAFEPVADNCRCWLANMRPWSNAHLHDCALGAALGELTMCTPSESTAWTFVSPGLGPRSIERRTLDSFQLVDVNLLKIDCEGYEIFVLEGARATLLRNRPVVIVEQKGGETRYGRQEVEAVTFLQSLGAVVRENLGGDYICTFTR